VADFKLLSQCFTGGTEKNHLNLSPDRRFLGRGSKEE
jgi:hypothetical protein